VFTIVIGGFIRYTVITFSEDIANNLAL